MRGSLVAVALALFCVGAAAQVSYQTAGEATCRDLNKGKLAERLMMVRHVEEKVTPALWDLSPWPLPEPSSNTALFTSMVNSLCADKGTQDLKMSALADVLIQQATLGAWKLPRPRKLGE